MPAKKTKKSSAKKNTGRKKSTKKTAKKRKITGKSCSKSKKAVKNKKSAKKQLLSFGLLQHEIDSLMEKHYKQKPDKQTQQKIMKELAEILPDEPIKPGQTKKHHHPVVKNMAKRAEYSPFVLDLSQEIAEKQKKNKEKQRIFSFFEKGQYTAPQVQETQERSEEKEKAFCRTKQAKPKLESISKIENNILAEHEEPIIEHSAKKEKQTNCDKEQFTKKPWFYHFNLPYLWHRKLAVYIAICLLIVIPIKGFGKYQKLQDSKQEIMTFATSAYEDLKIAGQALGDKNAKTASARFSNANTNLLQAEERLEKINPGIKTAINLVKQNSADIEDAKRLINTGKGITEIGKNISGLYEKFTKNNQTPLTQKVKTIRDELQKIIPKLDTINNNLNKIKISAVPKDNQEQFLQAGKFINVLTEDLKELSSFSKTINKILGEKYKKRYLFVFQNINELRPTGGFMGSLALVDINQG
ncbi:MAG TPA: hypothetical protein VKP03_01250, partial [Patescibacteria group bacterium]|nr:hypothetical protein [Patescibacteria group bacterium]